MEFRYVSLNLISAYTLWYVYIKPYNFNISIEHTADFPSNWVVNKVLQVSFDSVIWSGLEHCNNSYHQHAFLCKEKAQQ